jgi:hypothetical protein
VRPIILLYIAFALSSCVTAKKCADKFGTEPQRIVVRDTVEKLVQVPTPADSAELSIPLDSLARMLEELQADTTMLSRTIEEVSASGKLTVSAWIDKYNRALKIMAKQKPDTITKLVEVPVEVMADCPPSVVVTPDEARTWYEKLWRGFQFFSSCAMLLGIAFLLTVVIVKYKPWKLW